MVSSSRQRAVRIALREHREAAGLRLVDVTKALGWTINKLHRIETGESLATPVDVTRIMLAVGAPEAEVEFLARLAEDAQQPNWSVRMSGLPRHFGPLADFEAEATALTEVSVTTWPGLLQLPAYARALLAAAGVPARDIDPRVAFRMRRQEVLGRGGMPVEFRALVHEAVLHYRYGGLDVTRAQLRHLAAVCQRDHISVQVIPFAAEYTPVDGGYRILEFAKLPPLVHIEYPAGTEFIEQPLLVQTLLDFTTKLTQAAFSPADSLGLIEEEINRLETQ